jgi:hypothetical protein
VPSDRNPCKYRKPNVGIALEDTHEYSEARVPFSDSLIKCDRRVSRALIN